MKSVNELLGIIIDIEIYGITCEKNLFKNFYQ